MALIGYRASTNDLVMREYTYAHVYLSLPRLQNNGRRAFLFSRFYSSRSTSCHSTKVHNQHNSLSFFRLWEKWDAQPPPRCACFYFRLYPRWLNIVVLLLHHASNNKKLWSSSTSRKQFRFAGKGCERLILLVAFVCYSTYYPSNWVCAIEYRRLYNCKLELNLNDLLDRSNLIR